MKNNQMLAGFARVDISPKVFPVRTYLSAADKIVDPLYARAAAFSDGHETVVMVAFDVVILEWEYVCRMRNNLPQQPVFRNATCWFARLITMLVRR